MKDGTYHAMNGVVVYGFKGETYATPYKETVIGDVTEFLRTQNFRQDSSAGIPALHDAGFWDQKNWEEGVKRNNLMEHWQNISR